MQRAKVSPARLKAFRENVQFPDNPRLLGESIKVRKGEKKGVLTAVMYLAPAGRAVTYGGKGTTCPNATKGCIAACLGHSSGRLALDSSQNAQVWKTLAFQYTTTWFLKTLKAEIASHALSAGRKGLIPAVRLNGTSDITWENMGIFEIFPHVRFYDYTKDARRAAFLDVPNYHLTYSVSEHPNSLKRARLVLGEGRNVAVVFRTAYADELPDTFLGAPVIDGDESDVRFDDPRGVVVGLTCKGLKALSDNTGFVQEIDNDDD
jgi:hypothetical protein